MKNQIKSVRSLFGHIWYTWMHFALPCVCDVHLQVLVVQASHLSTAMLLHLVVTALDDLNVKICRGNNANCSYRCKCKFSRKVWKQGQHQHLVLRHQCQQTNSYRLSVRSGRWEKMITARVPQNHLHLCIVLPLYSKCVVWQRVPDWYTKIYSSHLLSIDIHSVIFNTKISVLVFNMIMP